MKRPIHQATIPIMVHRIININLVKYRKVRIENNVLNISYKI